MVVATVVALARDLIPPAPAVLGAAVVLFLLGITDVEQAFGGFSNPAPITVAALYVLARAVDVTGALQPVIGAVLGRAPGDGPGSRWRQRAQLGRLLVPTAGASGVLNNTPVVAMVAPLVVEWSRMRGLSASRLLMPLSFAAILGGLLTAIGTSTNLIVSGLLQRAGHPPLGMFEISRVGLPLVVVGVGLLVLAADRLLPERRPAVDTFSDVRRFSVTMRVLPGGPLDGVTVADAGLRDLQGVYLVQIRRDDHTIAPVGPDERLHGEDLLTFAGKVDLIVDLHRTRGLESTEQTHFGGLAGGEERGQTFFEAVVGEESPLHGRTLKEVGFRGQYQAAVVALHRAGERLDVKLGEVRLRTGDTLLILADEGFARRWRETGDFLLVARLGGSPPALSRKAPLVGVIGVGLVVSAALGLVSILQASLAAAGLLVVTKVLTPNQARNAVDLNVIVVIAAAFGIGAAIETTGLAAVAGGGIVEVFEPLGAIGALLGVMLATVVLTELVTNNAAAVLMFPVALSTAAVIGADVRPFAIAVAVAASASFLTPIGYQTNTMVYGLGGYRYTDFARLGFPLTLAVLVVGVAIPLAWPL